MNLYFPYDKCLVILEFKQSRIINSYIFHRCTKSSHNITLHKAKHAIGSCYVSNEIYKYMLVPKSRTCALCAPTAQHWLSGYTVKNLCKWEEFLSFLLDRAKFLGRADFLRPHPLQASPQLHHADGCFCQFDRPAWNFGEHLCLFIAIEKTSL